MNKSEKKNDSSKNILDKLNDSFLKENKLIFKKYKPLKIIGKGAFGKIYSTIRLEDKSVFAMKTEKINTPRKMLETEAYFLILLQGFGIPKLITFGHTKNYNILIETLLGETLHDIFIRTKKPCDLKNMCLIAIQLIERLEFIHSKNIVYRDVKPENFMIGIKDPNIIYIVDFGLCKKYRSSKTGKHMLPRDTKKFNGTLKYSSVNVVKGKESSRRDDLISLGYVLIFLYKRNLPWTSDFKSLNRKTYFELVMTKLTNAGGDLFKNIPKELADYVKYCQNLKFEEDPNYNYMKGFFQKILNKYNCNIKKMNFCWIKPNDKNNKSLPRKKSNPRNRILKNLETERCRKIKFNSLEKNNKCQKNSVKNKDIINNKNEYILNYYTNSIHNPNDNANNKLIENHSNVNHNSKQTENIDSNISLYNYINGVKNDKQKNNIRTSINPMISIKKNILANNNSLMNSVNDSKMRINKNINHEKKIYINNNHFNLGTERNNKIPNNPIHHRKINKIVCNNYNRNIRYKPKMEITFTDFNNSHKYSSNTITNNKNVINNNYLYPKFIEYSSVLSNKQSSNNLYDSYNNNSKWYKIKRKDYHYINDNINNTGYYYVRIDNRNKNLKTRNLTEQRLDI